jgi:hypothetical protein
MEPEGSLPCSQEPSTGPHPEPSYLSILILSNHLILVFLVVSLIRKKNYANINSSFVFLFIRNSLNSGNIWGVIMQA